MRRKRIVSAICLVTMLMNSMPVGATEVIFRKTELTQSDNSKPKEDVTNEKDESVNTENKENELTQKQENTSVSQSKSEPKIKVPESIILYLGDTFNYKEWVKATDSYGKDISDLVTIKGEVDTSKVGTYEVEYSVKDEYDQTATLKRSIKVIEKNVFNAYTEKVHEETKEKIKELLFSISLDTKTSKFVVDNQSTEMIDPSKENETAFKIRVLDKDGKEKLAIDLLGKDTGDSKKLDALKELDYSYGDFLEINPMELMKDRFNIEGPILGDVDITKEDYSDGVDNEDYILNVRFEITEEGIKSVYNEAPEITGLNPMDKLLTTRNEQLEGIAVTDDHDKEIQKENIKITEEKDGENNTIGLRYEVSDSWGRTISMLRPLKNVPELAELIAERSRNIVSYSSDYMNSIAANIINVHGSEYQDGNTLRFSIKFNTSTNKFEVINRDSRKFDNKMKDKYFELILYSKSGKEKSRLTLNGSDRADDKKIDDFNNTSFEFGDQIALFHAYSGTKLRIEGSIQGLTGNNDGISSENLDGKRFEITESGLKHLINNPPTITWEGKEQNTIKQITRGQRIDLLTDIEVEDDIDGKLNRSIVSVTSYDPNTLGIQTVTYTVTDSWGATSNVERQINIVSNTNMANTYIDIYNKDGSQKAFSINFDDVDKKIFVSNLLENAKLDESNPNSLAFRIRVFSKAGITKKDISLNGGTNVSESKISELNNYRFADGDTIQVWSSTPGSSIKIRGTIDKHKDITEDSYEDGIQDVNFMNNVRFQLGSDTLKALYNTAPKIVFKDNLTIKRGETFNPLDFVEKVDDDYDTLNKELIRVSYDKEAITEAGIHEITYKITDKWGLSSEVTKDIVVLPKNKLEENSISLLKQDIVSTRPDNKDSEDDGLIEDTVVSLHFDDIEKRLVAYVNENVSISGEANSNVFVVTVYDGKTGQQKAKSIIKANESLSSSSFSEITNEEINYNDMIQVSAYLPEKVSINGDVRTYVKNTSEDSFDKTDKYKTGFEDDEYMNNTRFIVTEKGLIAKYNAAPTFVGVETATIIKGTEFDERANVSVTDDHDENLTERIEVSGTVDENQLGPQTVTYKVSDSWGRTIQKTRTVIVDSKSSATVMQLKNSDNTTVAFKIGFNMRESKFKVFEQNPTQINPTNAGEEFRITIFDHDDNVVQEVKLNGTDTGNSDKLNILNRTPATLGYKIALWASDSTRLSIDTTILKGSEITEDNFADGIDNADFMNNVRFEATADGVRVIYNQAPVIQLPNDGTEIDNSTSDDNTSSSRTSSNTVENGRLILYKGDDYRSQLLEGVTATDDKDSAVMNAEYLKENMKIVAIKENTSQSEPDSGEAPGTGEAELRTGDNSQEEENPSRELELSQITEIGEYTIKYSIKDIWGRVSEVKTRRVKIIPSIDRNTIVFASSLSGNRYEAFKIGFDSINKRIVLKDRTSKQFHNQVGNKPEFYKISVYHGSGERKGELKIPTIILSNSENSNSTKLNALDGLPYEEGDYIRINAYQAFAMMIRGPVRDALEDYSTYVTYADDFVNTNFVITEAGLKAEFMPENLETNESLIEFIGTNGGTPFKMKLNHETGTISYPSTTEFYNYDILRRDAFKVHYYKASENRVYSYTSTGAENGVNQQLKNKLNGRFYDGDYFTFEYVNIPDRFKGLRISGAISEEHKNYTQYLTSKNDIKNVRFYLRTNGTQKYIEPLYSHDIEFSGVEDISIYEEDVARFNPRDNVTAYDKTNNNNSVDYTVSEVRLNGIGKYTYTYTATNSWGKRTTVNRTVYVRPKIYKNRIKLYSQDDIVAANNDNSSGGGTTDIPPESEIVPEKPAFEIGFDNDTNKYVVMNAEDKALNTSLPFTTVFKMLIYNGSGTLKETIELTGNDRGTSSKLQRLNEVVYDQNDYIRLWTETPENLHITGNITGQVQDANNVYNNGITNDEYMNHVAFKPNSEGLTTLHNTEPQFVGLNETIEVLYGDTVNLKSGFTVSDDKDTSIPLDRVQVTGDTVQNGTISTNELGKQVVTYTVADSWGRQTSKDVTYNVVSKMKENSIEVYGKSSAGVDEHKFTLKFNVNTNRITVERKEGITESTESVERYFELVLKNKDGKEKKKVILNQTQLVAGNQDLQELTTIPYINGDTISLYCDTPANIKIKGEVEANVTGQSVKDFSNGFDEKATFEKVKFKINNSGFTVIQRESLGITVNDISVKRGDMSEVYNGIGISAVDADNRSNVSIDIQNLQIETLGEQSVQYVITDSWGTKQIVNGKIIVTERNDLEKNKIRLLDTSNGKRLLLELQIDTINKRIVPVRTTNTYNGTAQTLLTVKVFDDSGINRDTLTVTRENLDSLQAIDYQNGDLISISSYDDRNALSITGTITEQKENYEDGVSTPDYIQNVRFKINGENYLKSIYNNEPILNVEDTLTLYKDDKVDLYNGVEAKDNDPFDTTVSLADVQVETDLDITKIGRYTATYILADTWGREVRKTRTILVKSSLENTKVEYYAPNTNTPAFDIAIDNVNNKFVVTKHYNTVSNFFKRNIFKRSTNENSSESNGETNDNEAIDETKVFELILYNSNGEPQKSIQILSDANRETVDAQLDAFNETEFNFGDYISVYSRDYQNGIKIKGNIDKASKITEDYSTGIENPDFMKNVRFKINVEALEGVYNEKPTFEIKNPNTVIPVYKGDNHDYSIDTIIKDDLDLDIGAANISISEEDREKMNTVGNQTINIIVTDSWGRRVSLQRTYKVLPAIDRNEILFTGHDKNSTPSRFVPFKIGFNSTTKQIEVRDRDGRQIHNQASRERFYEINVYHGSGAQKDQKKIQSIILSHGDSALRASQLDRLHQLSFNYGDYITIYAYQAFAMKILGPVRNQLEDYSDYVDLADDFNNTKFIITEAGLQAEFQPQTINDDQTYFEFLGTNGGTPFKLIISGNGSVSFPTNVTEFYNYSAVPENQRDVDVFRVKYFKQSTGTVTNYTSKGRENGVHPQLKTALRSGVNVGDYFAFEYLNIPDKFYGLRVTGKLRTEEGADDELIEEDYSDGIQNKRNLTEVRFYIVEDENGNKTVEVRRVAAATIEGATDTEVLQNSTFNTRTDVRAIDSDGRDITGRMTVTGDVNTARIGLNEVKYEVTNDAGVKTTVSRNISVYTEASIALRNGTIDPIEQGSMLTEEEQNEYLKRFVLATDTETNADISDDVVVTKNEINIEQPGTYNVSFQVTNSFGKVSVLEDVPVEVIRTISVSVPTTIPFQLVTNLVEGNTNDPFIAGKLSLKNNKTSDVQVYVKSFTKQSESGNLDIVAPTTYDDEGWSNLSAEDSMSKLALGMFVDSGINGDNLKSRENPLWFSNNMTTETHLGTLPRSSSLNTYNEAKLSFTSKHGNNFKGGRSKGKFELVFEFR